MPEVKLTEEEVQKEGLSRRRPRAPDDVRAKVLDAAFRHFSVMGYEGTSVRAVAKDANVSISLLFYHFDTKENLWNELVDQLSGTHSIRRSIRNRMDCDSASATEILRVAIDEIVRMSVERPGLHRMMTIEGSRPSKRLARMCDTYVGHEFEFMIGLISAAQKEGSVRDLSPERLWYAILSIAAVPFAVAAEYEYLTNRDPFTQNEIDQTCALINTLLFK